MEQLFARLWQIAGFAIIGGVGFVVGLGLQWLLVKAGLNVVTAYTLQVAVTIWLNYELNRRITWKDSTHSVTTAVQFVFGRLLTAGAGWVFFVLLVQLHIHHMAANAISVVAAMAANFVIGDKVFRTPTPDSSLLQEELS